MKYYFFLSFLTGFITVAQTHLPAGFIYLAQIDPSIQQDVRYFTAKNFMGTPVDGYEAPKIILTKQAALALKKVQGELREQGLGLKIFDGYRPQSAVDHFVRWARDPDDTLNKSSYYPRIPKSQLFEQGYIAVHSGHSGGSTVDVTLVNLKTGRELDMGTSFDFFGPRSWPDSMVLSEGQYNNRMLLQKIMKKHGFKPLQTEWWHFTLKHQPFPDTYFDFPVK